MILKLNPGASQHGFATPAEAAAAGRSYAVLDGDGRPEGVGLPFEVGGRRGVSFVHAADLWDLPEIGIDCVFVGSASRSRRHEVPRGTDRVVTVLREARDEVIAIRRTVSLGGPADHAAMMVISAVDALSAFLAGLKPMAAASASRHDAP